jgi:hypothetical protein
LGRNCAMVVIFRIQNQQLTLKKWYLFEKQYKTT